MEFWKGWVSMISHHAAAALWKNAIRPISRRRTNEVWHKNENRFDFVSFVSSLLLCSIKFTQRKEKQTKERKCFHIEVNKVKGTLFKLQLPPWPWLFFVLETKSLISQPTICVFSESRLIVIMNTSTSSKASELSNATPSPKSPEPPAGSKKQSSPRTRSKPAAKAVDKEFMQQIVLWLDGLPLSRSRSELSIVRMERDFADGCKDFEGKPYQHIIIALRSVLIWYFHF